MIWFSFTYIYFLLLQPTTPLRLSELHTDFEKPQDEDDDDDE